MEAFAGGFEAGGEWWVRVARRNEAVGGRRHGGFRDYAEASRQRRQD